MKKNLQMQFYRNKGLKVVCFGLLLSGMVPGAVYAGSPGISSLTTVANARVNVTGTVTDSKGEPLPGVSVKIKGTNAGTSTDVNGVFRLNLPTGKETLVISYIGFKSQEVAVGGRTNISVKLMEDSKALDEVVVVGYGVQKRAHLTGSVVDIKASEVEDLPVTNLSTALSGRLLGVGVSGGAARPGSTGTITIRQENPFTGKEGSNPPLYVIDGVLQLTGQGKPDNTLFNSLDPSEIESISVLKDAAAAVYGTRAGNGVVIVTTKKGKAGAPKVSYSGSYAINDAAYRPKMLNAYEFGMYMNIMNGPNGANITAPTAIANAFFSQDELEHFKTIDYDWLKPAWSSAYNTSHTLSMNGGSERATYFASVSYNKQNGNLSTLDWDRYNFRAGSDVKISNSFKVGLQLSGNTSQLDKTFNKVSGEDDEDDYQALLRAPRYVPMYIDGYPVKLPGTASDLSAYHFYEIKRLNNLSKTNSKTFTVNINAEYDVPFVKGLKARASYARNMGSSSNDQIGTKYNLYQFDKKGTNGHIYDGASLAASNSSVRVSNGNRVWFSNSDQTNTQTNFSLNYTKTIGKHSLSGLFVVERSEGEDHQEDVYKADPIESTNGQLLTAFGELGGRSSKNEFGSLGYIGRANYSYADKYLVEFLFRSDASTKFSPENYWGSFYSGSIGWVVSEEEFFKVPAINYLKLRYSAGLLGNDNTGAWLWRQRYTAQEGKGAVLGGDNTGATVGMKMEKSPNPDATWSDEFKNNIGVDARFLNERLSATVEGFYNKATNILIERTDVPLTIGGSVAAENYGKADFFGYELELGWNDKLGKDFRYGISGRFGWSDNKVRQMNFNATDILKPWNKQPNQSNDNGVWGYDVLGMFKNQEDIDAYFAQYPVKQVHGQTITSKADLHPGMLYYRDIRGALQSDGTFAGPDGIIDENDQIQLAKKASNHYSFGMTIRAGYKSFNFESVIGGSFGGWAEHDGTLRKKLSNSIDRNYYSLPSIWNNIYDPQLNPSGTMPNPNWEAISLSKTSNFWKVSAFRMRMVNANLSYTLPKRFIEKVKISNARVYCSVVNPFSFYNPFDYRAADQTWEAYPTLRTVSFGLNVGF